MSTSPSLTIVPGPDELILVAGGSWTAAYAPALEGAIASAERALARPRQARLDLAALASLDTVGSWLIERVLRRAAASGCDVKLSGLPDRYAGIVDRMHFVNREPARRQKNINPIWVWLDSIGRLVVNARIELMIVVSMLGQFAAALVRTVLRPQNFRLTSAVYHTYRVGWQAIPIIVLITFLIGAIIAQQGIFHFRKFGAESYVVDMVGILVLREIGVLIVAIMVAGRSGSAYTAELGSMKMREEIDALRTMDLNPVDILIVPRVIALIVGLPILAVHRSNGCAVRWRLGSLAIWWHEPIDLHRAIARSSVGCSFQSWDHQGAFHGASDRRGCM